MLSSTAALWSDNQRIDSRRHGRIGNASHSFAPRTSCTARAARREAPAAIGASSPGRFAAPPHTPLLTGPRQQDLACQIRRARAQPALFSFEALSSLGVGTRLRTLDLLAVALLAAAKTAQIGYASHAHMHSLAPARTHAHAHARSLSLPLSLPLPLPLLLPLSLSPSLSPPPTPLSRTRTRTRAHAHTYTHARGHTHPRARTNTKPAKAVLRNQYEKP